MKNLCDNPEDEIWCDKDGIAGEGKINQVDMLKVLNATLEREVARLEHCLRWISPKDELPPDCTTVEFEFYRTFGVTEWGHGYVTTNPPLDPTWHLVANGRSEELKPYQRVERWRPL